MSRRSFLDRPRLRFLLADDPGAGKTIMGGLLIKEMNLRQAIERILIVVPAPLTLQWQKELLRFFGETFQIIGAANDQSQLIDLWQRERQVLTRFGHARLSQPVPDLACKSAELFLYKPSV